MSYEVIIIIIAIAVVAAVAIWRVTRLTDRLSALQSQLTAAEIHRDNATEALETFRRQAEETAAASRAEIERLTNALDESTDSVMTLREDNAALTTTVEHLRSERETREEQIRAERAEHDKRLEAQMRDLANSILRQNSADFKAQHEEKLREILTPLRENLDSFRKTVTETYDHEARERFSLTEKIRELVELNNTISREARDLTNALRGNNRVQGDWGEMVLEGILKQSGLHEGSEYFLQMTDDGNGRALKSESGQRLRPDVVVKYPDGRCVVIDSKVSLTAFVEWSTADDDKNAREYAESHVRSVRAHVSELVGKNYQSYIGESKLDFVMMFIPNEPAYIAAMRHDPRLWEDAYKNKVLIVSPTHLVSGLRLIEQLWSRDKVTKNAIRIAEDAGKMYDKFVDFVKDLEDVGKAVEKAQNCHRAAMNKLKDGTGNLIKRTENLRLLGIKASKQLSATLIADAGADSTSPLDTNQD